MIDYSFDDLTADLKAVSAYDRSTASNAERRIKAVFTSLLRAFDETAITREISLDLSREIARLRCDLEIAKTTIAMIDGQVRSTT